MAAQGTAADILFENLSGLTRLPLPEKPEDETDVPERHHFGSEELRRITHRMMRALSRLGASPGQPVAIVPGTALEHFLLWAASCALGAHPVVLNDATTVDAPVLICPPADKADWQQRAPQAKVATLGGPWSGSFFMLQMVQPETPPTVQATPGETRFADATQALPFDALLERADALATTMKEAQAVLLCLPPLADASSLLAVLAAMRSGRPLFWLPPAEVKKGLAGANLPDNLLAIAAPEVVEPLRRRLPVTARVLTPGDMRA